MAAELEPEAPPTEKENDDPLNLNSQPGPKAVSWLERIGLDIASIVIVLLGILVTASVIGRVVWGVTIPDDIVIAGEFMVTLVALPWAFVTADRGHISVEIFTNWVPPTGRAFLDIVAGLVALIMVIPLTWATGVVFFEAWEFGNYFDGDLYLPEWPGRLAFFVGFAFMSLRFFLWLVKDGVSIGRRDFSDSHHHDEFF